MKKKLHPTNHPVVFVDTSCGAEFVTTSTIKSEATKQIDGVNHYVLNVEISSASHPFYTGKQILVDTARRVEKFKERAGKQEDATVRKGKKGKKAKAATKKTETKKIKKVEADKDSK